MGARTTIRVAWALWALILTVMVAAALLWAAKGASRNNRFI